MSKTVHGHAVHRRQHPAAPGTGYGKTGAYPARWSPFWRSRTTGGEQTRAGFPLDYLEPVKAPQRTTDSGIAIRPNISRRSEEPSWRPQSVQLSPPSTGREHRPGRTRRPPRFPI